MRSDSLLLVVLAGLGACRSTPSLGARDAAPHPPTPRADAAPVRPSPPFPEDTRSLRLRRSIAVRYEPREDAKLLGTIGSDTRVDYLSVAPGGDAYCPHRWVEIQPRGWICEKYLEPSRKPPFGDEEPRLKAGEIVPGTYGKVIGDGAKTYRSLKDLHKKKVARTLLGSVTVHKVGEVTDGGKRYWKTQAGELIDEAHIQLHQPSRFAGLRLDTPDAPGLPLAWAQSRKDLLAKIAVRSAPGGDSKRSLAPRTVVPVVELSPDGKFARVGDKEWIASADLHFARRAAPPPDLEDGGRWLDVDLDEQVVVAFEGLHPVYATMVSTGSPQWPTATGIYRIWIKFAETDMSGQMGDEQPYSVATVPWTMFFAKDLAFHTAYWHDRFGEARSHGCVNVSPIDARLLYFWAGPDVPLGWSMSRGIVERPGSLVKVHSAATPEPEYKGYARIVHDARQGDAGGAHGVEPEALGPDAGAFTGEDAAVEE